MLIICRDEKEDKEWIHKAPILDRHYAKLIEEYAKENDLVSEEKMMELKAINEFPGYWRIFTWNSIFFLFYTICFLGTLTDGLYHIAFLGFCFAYN